MIEVEILWEARQEQEATCAVDGVVHSSATHGLVRVEDGGAHGDLGQAGQARVRLGRRARLLRLVHSVGTEGQAAAQSKVVTRVQSKALPAGLDTVEDPGRGNAGNVPLPGRSELVSGGRGSHLGGPDDNYNVSMRREYVRFLYI